MKSAPALNGKSAPFMDTMKCPNCGAAAKRDPGNREDRFVCSNRDCGWVSWKTRVEMLRDYLDKEKENA